MEHVKLGLLGLSEGNGHPYSWAAICNGYDAEAMSRGPYPVIADYLGKRSFPDDAIENATVTHVWCENSSDAEDVARCSLIETVVTEREKMIGAVDAILLARDDADRHMEHAKPFLDAGVPIYIDKPLGYTVAGAEALLAARREAGQIFTCSALRFDDDLLTDAAELASLGPLQRIEAKAPKSWERYAIHVLEPLLASVLEGDPLPCSDFRRADGVVQAAYRSDKGFVLEVTVNEAGPSPIEIVLEGERGRVVKRHQDSFTAFKKALERFLAVVTGTAPAFSDDEMLAPIRMIDVTHGGRTS